MKNRNISIQQAEENDLTAILALQKESFSMVAKQMNKFSLPPLLQTIEDIYNEYRKGIILKYTSDSGRIIGSIRGYIDENGTCHIGKLIVHPDFQNKGIGKKLMYEIEEYFPSCCKLSLFTGEETPNTLHLYSKVGYHTIQKKDMDGINMIIMEKEKLTYRNLIPNDVETICKLPLNEQELFFMCPKADYPLTIEQLGEIIKDRLEPTVVLFDNEIVGFANFYEIKEKQYCAIGNVIVNSHFRNRGIGTFLITVMENIGRQKYSVSEIHLSCFNENTNGLLLYTQLGYNPYEIEKRIKKNNNPSALIKMRKIL